MEKLHAERNFLFRIGTEIDRVSLLNVSTEGSRPLHGVEKSIVIDEMPAHTHTPPWEYRTKCDECYSPLSLRLPLPDSGLQPPRLFMNLLLQLPLQLVPSLFGRTSEIVGNEWHSYLSLSVINWFTVLKKKEKRRKLKKSIYLLDNKE